MKESTAGWTIQARPPYGRAGLGTFIGRSLAPASAGDPRSQVVCTGGVSRWQSLRLSDYMSSLVTPTAAVRWPFVACTARRPSVCVSSFRCVTPPLLSAAQAGVLHRRGSDRTIHLCSIAHALGAPTCPRRRQKPTCLPPSWQVSPTERALANRMSKANREDPPTHSPVWQHVQVVENAPSISAVGKPTFTSMPRLHPLGQTPEG